MDNYPAVLQIRNGSSRFPGKAMKTILGRPVIYYLIERIVATPAINRLVVATTSAPADDALADYCTKNKVEVFRGDEQNVLDRIYRCVKDWKDEYFVKYWGDSPLIDPFLCHDLIRRLDSRFAGYDYVSNNHPSTYPEGMQIEIIRTGAFRKAVTTLPLKDEDREHVTPCLWRRTDLFKIGNVEHTPNIHDRYRLCLDYSEDFDQIRGIVEALHPRDPLFRMEDMMKFLDEHPEIKRINEKYYETEEAYYRRIGEVRPN